MSKGILIDTTRCIDCQRCVVACKLVNGLIKDDKGKYQPADPFRQLTADVGLPTDAVGAEVLSFQALNVVETHGDVYVRRFCMHCADPTCVSVCPVGAFKKTSTGPVVYDEDKCIGCRYCMMACPFGIPRYEWNRVWTPRVKKCTMCANRQAKGMQPACTAVCPAQAGVFGERDDLLREAENRLHQDPHKYVQHIYGKDEVGGTSVLFLSAVPFEQLGLPTNLPMEAIPDYTFRVVSKLPRLASIGAVLLGGVYWITSRRDDVARAEREEEEKKKKGR